MNRAALRAEVRVARKRGRGWTKSTRPESAAQSIAVELGSQRMAHVAAHLDRLPLSLNGRTA